MRSPWHDLLPLLRLIGFGWRGNLFTAEQDMEPERDLRTRAWSWSPPRHDGRHGGLSVVDLGCLRGRIIHPGILHAGATTRVLGIELRCPQCQSLQHRRGLHGPEADCRVSAGVRHVRSAPCRRRSLSDIVFAAEILSRLDRPAKTLRLMRRMCTRFALVDTHIATRNGPTTHYCSEGEVELPGGGGEGGYRGQLVLGFDISTHNLPAAPAPSYGETGANAS